MEIVIIGGLLLVLWAVSQKPAAPAPAPTPAQQRVILEVQARDSGNPITPAVAPATQDAPLPIALLQQPNPATIPFPGNPDVHNFGSFGPPPPVWLGDPSPLGPGDMGNITNTGAPKRVQTSPITGNTEFIVPFAVQSMADLG